MLTDFNAKLGARILALLLMLCLLVPQLAACKPSQDEPKDTDAATQGEETSATPAPVIPDELSLLTTGGFFADGTTLRMTRVNEDPVLDLSNRFSVGLGSKWCLASDEAGNNELTKKSVTLSEGENVFYVKVTFRKDVQIYKAIVNYHEAFTVEFYSGCNEKVNTQAVDKGGKATRPVTPTREGYTFAGWYLDGNPFEFTTAITESCTLIAHWKKNSGSYGSIDLTPEVFDGINAGMSIVWKDYANANATRPNEVVCVLTRTCGGQVTTYEIVVKQDSVAWKDPANAPDGVTLAQGEGGEWTLSLRGLPEKLDNKFCSYSLRQEPVGKNYSTLPCGTSTVNTVIGYQPSVDESAKLTTRNARLYDAAGNLVVLQGVVTLNVGVDGLEDTTSVTALKRLAAVGCNGIRLTAQLIGQQNKGNGYVYYSNGSSRTDAYNDSNAKRVSESDKQKMLASINTVIANATEAGLYIVIDWGILTSNPYQYVNEACEFFGILAEKHASNPYVIFEICNEPHSDWGGSAAIKAYAERVIDTIRGKGSDAIVIVAPKGSATNLSAWSSSGVAGDDPIDDPLDDDRRYNVAYTFHCYPFNYDYDADYSWKLRDAHEAGLTVIVTEMSPIDATYDVRSELNYDMAHTANYVRMFQEWDVGFFYFRYASPENDYNEWMMFRPNLKLTLRDWTRDDLTECGKWYYDILRGNGIFTKVDKNAERIKEIIADFDKTHAAYGLANVFPGFAVSSTKSGTTYFFKVNTYDSLTDIQYETYCTIIWDRVYEVAKGSAKLPNGTAFSDASVPTKRTEPMELTYSYNGKSFTLKISYGQNTSSGSYGITFDVH